MMKRMRLSKLAFRHPQTVTVTATDIESNCPPEAKMADCPKCGEHTDTLHEGYCEPCREDNQSALDLHNAEFDRWQSLSNGQRDVEIRRAAAQST